VEIGQAVEVMGQSVRIAHGEDDRDRLGPGSSRDEPEDLARGGIQPLRVLHEAEKRPVLGYRRQQAEHGEPDHEPVRDSPRGKSQADVEGIALRGRQRVDTVEHRRAHLRNAGVRQFHLRLHARKLGDPEA
jgi:hypothetical protein